MLSSKWSLDAPPPRKKKRGGGGGGGSAAAEEEEGDGEEYVLVERRAFAELAALSFSFSAAKQPLEVRAHTASMHAAMATFALGCCVRHRRSVLTFSGLDSSVMAWREGRRREKACGSVWRLRWCRRARRKRSARESSRSALRPSVQPKGRWWC